MPAQSASCPLCQSAGCAPFAADHLRSRLRAIPRHYWRCPDCGLIHRDRSEWPTAAAERAHYALHENHPDDPDYRRFLQPLVDALRPQLPAGAQGLDFGCGPGPALAAMLREAGHSVALYDPAFAADASVLSRRYGFVTASEVVEHLHRPAEVFARLDALLEPGGWLGILTATPPDAAADFLRWYYPRDPTHVLFYPQATMRWIARQLGWQAHFPVPNVTLFQRPGSDRDAVPREGAD